MIPSLSQALEISTGVTSFGRQGDGVWYQAPFTHQLNTIFPSFSIGIKRKISDTILYRFGYEYMGTVTTYALATPSDDDYIHNGKYALWPLSHWYGKGKVEGLYGSVLYKYHSVIFEGGIYVYRPTWEMTVPDWEPCKYCPQQYLKVVHNPLLNITPFIGLGYEMKDTTFVITARQTQTRGDQWPAFYKGISYKAELRYNF